MNKDQFAGQWKAIKGKIKEKWGKLTDDELTQIEGRRDQLVGLIQKKYGLDKARVEEDLTRLESTLTSVRTDASFKTDSSRSDVTRTEQSRTSKTGFDANKTAAQPGRRSSDVGSTNFETSQDDAESVQYGRAVGGKDSTSSPKAPTNRPDEPKKKGNW